MVEVINAIRFYSMGIGAALVKRDLKESGGLGLMQKRWGDSSGYKITQWSKLA